MPRLANALASAPATMARALSSHAAASAATCQRTFEAAAVGIGMALQTG